MINVKHLEVRLSWTDGPNLITRVLKSREHFSGEFSERCDIAGFADRGSGQESKNVDGLSKLEKAEWNAAL